VRCARVPFSKSVLRNGCFTLSLVAVPGIVPMTVTVETLWGFLLIPSYSTSVIARVLGLKRASDFRRIGVFSLIFSRPSDPTVCLFS
jgi:hypothetical protein